jgi:hypothetical protein
MINSSLSRRCREIILGSLLGDGSLRLQKNYKNARFSFRHSIKQKEYFLWKAQELKEISGSQCVWLQKGRDGWGQDKLCYQSVAYEELTKIYLLTHSSDHLKIRRKWLNKLSPLSLCVWWLDAGSLVSDCRQGVLCTDRFTFKELLIVVRYFRKVWHINFHIGRVAQSGARSHQYRLWLRSSEELKKFLWIILPHFRVPSMLPKVLILYKDPQLQERWISEVCQLSGMDRKVVESVVSRRKNELAYYRE